MWSAMRAEAARRELEALASSSLDTDEVHAQSLAVIGTVVPFEAACVGAVDPDTLVLTSGITLGFDPSEAESELFVQIEYGVADPSSFANLVELDVPLVHAGDVHPSRRGGVRFNELSRALGFASDVRLTFSTGGRCWAVGDLYRGPGRDFEARELEFLAGVTDVVAVATRRAVAARTPAATAATTGPEVIVLTAAGAVTSITPAARERLAELDLASASHLRHALAGVVALVAAGAPSAQARVPAGAGWIVLRASTLDGLAGPDLIAVTIEAATGGALVDLLVSAHGLSSREREVCLEVLAGRSTTEVAGRLFISANTVQDHLKSIFTKTGLRSRRELVAHLGAIGE